MSEPVLHYKVFPMKISAGRICTAMKNLSIPTKICPTPLSIHPTINPFPADPELSRPKLFVPQTVAPS